MLLTCINNKTYSFFWRPSLSKSQLSIQSNINWMPEHSETFISLSTKYLPTLLQYNHSLVNQTLPLSNPIQDSPSSPSGGAPISRFTDSLPLLQFFLESWTLGDVRISSFLLIRRHPDLNWGIRDLQSPALPLGHVAKRLQTKK